MIRPAALALLAIGWATCSGCGTAPDLGTLQPGSQLAVRTHDGIRLRGRLLEVRPGVIVLAENGTLPTVVARGEIAAIEVEAAPPRGETAAWDGTTAASRPGASRDVILPAGTVIPLVLDAALTPDTNRVGDEVRGRVRETAQGDARGLPDDTIVIGSLVEVSRPDAPAHGRVAVRFHTILLPGAVRGLPIQCRVVATWPPIDTVGTTGGAGRALQVQELGVTLQRPLAIRLPVE